MTEGSFEGDISLRVTASDGASKTLDYQVKGDKMRLHASDSDTYLIIDWKARKGYTISDESKRALPFDISRMAARIRDKNPGLKVSSTGQTDSVLGYGCERIDVALAGRSLSACVVKGIGWFGGHGQGTFAFFLPEEGLLFPLQVTEKDASGTQTLHGEATKIEKKKIPDVLLELPPGYEVVGGLAPVASAHVGADREKAGQATP